MVLSSLFSLSPLLIVQPCACTPLPSLFSGEQGVNCIPRQPQGPGKMEGPLPQAESLQAWMGDCTLILNMNGSLCRGAGPGADKRPFWPSCGSKCGLDYLPEASRGLGKAAGDSGQAEAGFEFNS